MGINSTSHIVPTIIEFAFEFRIKEWILVFCWDCVCLILFTENISWLMLRINKLLQESKYQSLLFQVAFPRKANVSQRRSSPLPLSLLLEISRVLNHAAEDTLASVECAWNHRLTLRGWEKCLAQIKRKLPQKLVSVSHMDMYAWVIQNVAAKCVTMATADHSKINDFAKINTVFSSNERKKNYENKNSQRR